MAWGLPKLPGYSFPDPTKSNYTLSRKFEYINGYRCMKPDVRGIGNEPIDVDSSAFLSLTDPSTYDPSLTYGRVKTRAMPQVLPHWVHYDSKCITFKAFLRQAVPESPLEHFRIRFVNIIYFLEDDTITVMEPATKNSGIWQGRLVRRCRIAKNSQGDCYHWKDLNVGMDINIYGNVFHVYACDDFSKEFLLSQGIDLAEDEEPPKDPYAERMKWSRRDYQRQTPLVDDKLRRFLEYEGKALTFDAVWDDRHSELGEMRPYKLIFFLEDDTIAIKELHDPRGGREPFPLLLKRTRVPKNWKDKPVNYPAIVLEATDAEVSEFYAPRDLIVGETVFILGRRFLIFDCDAFTRNYYRRSLGFNQPARIEVAKEETKEYVKPLPPHIGIGDPEDALGSCFTVMPKPPKKDVIKYILNANKHLRYTCVKDPDLNPEDVGRQFVLAYSLADSTIRINEVPRRNSGIREGCFLSSMRVELPDSDRNFPSFYTPDKFYIGAMIYVFKHRFIITGCDLFVYRYMQANPGKFPSDVIENIRNYHLRAGNLKEDLQEAIEEEATAERKRQMDRIGQEVDRTETELQQCLDRLRVVEGSQTPPPPKAKEELADNMEYDEYLKYLRQKASVCAPSPVMTALQAAAAGQSEDQRVVCFTGPAAAGHQPQSPVISRLEQERMARFQEPIIPRGPEECQLPVIIKDSDARAEEQREHKVQDMSSLEKEFGIKCEDQRIPDFMRLPPDVYTRAGEYKKRLEEQTAGRNAVLDSAGVTLPRVGMVQGAPQPGTKTVTFADPPLLPPPTGTKECAHRTPDPMDVTFECPRMQRPMPCCARAPQCEHADAPASKFRGSC